MLELQAALLRHAALSMGASQAGPPPRVPSWKLVLLHSVLESRSAIFGGLYQWLLLRMTVADLGGRRDRDLDLRRIEFSSKELRSVNDYALLVSDHCREEFLLSNRKSFDDALHALLFQTNLRIEPLPEHLVGHV